MNPYAVLNVPSNATHDEIKKAFKRKAVLLHPDKGNEASGERFRELLLARDTLLKSLPSTSTSQWNGFSTNFSNPMNDKTAFFKTDSSNSFNSFNSYNAYNTSHQTHSFFTPPPFSAFPTFPTSPTSSFYSTYMENLKKDTLNRNYLFNGRYFPKIPKNSNYINVATGREIKNLKRKDFIYMDVSQKGLGPFFCGEEEAIKEFCKTNEIKQT